MVDWLESLQRDIEEREMDTKIYRFLREESEWNEEEENWLREAGEVLKNGGLVAFPTETVYGLGGDALNAESSHKIYAAKGRPSDNPLIVHIAKWEDIYRIVEEVPEQAKKLADAFWPGPMTMILRKSEIVPLETTGGLETVAVRFPSHKLAQKLISYAGGCVAAPSANTSGKPSPTLSKYVEEDMVGKIDMILDGGEEVGIGLESTIIDITVNPPQILRPGYITQTMLEKVLGKVDVDQTILKNDTGLAPKAPGMKYRHYAPKGELTIVEGNSAKVVSYVNGQIAAAKEQGKRTGIIATEENLSAYRADFVKCAGSRSEEEEIAKNLYNILREFDDDDVDVIYSESFSGDGLGQAIMNRLLKAAGHRIITIS